MHCIDTKFTNVNFPARMDQCRHLNCQIGDYCMICGDCGLEMEEERAGATTDYTTKAANDDFNKYMSGVDPAVRRQVIDSFERVLEQHVVRGVGRKALLAACFMYESGIVTTSRDVSAKFELERKRFGEGKRLFLTYNRRYRTMIRPISDYTPLLLNTFDVCEETRRKTMDACAKMEKDDDFVNFSPYSVCACLLYNCMTDVEHKRVKKNVFTTRVGMSDKTVDKIMSLLRQKT